MDKSVARTAAKWWADFLRNGNAPLDNGDKSETGAITFILASLLHSAETSNTRPDDAQKYEDALASILETQKDARWFSVGVDYGPDPILLEAARIANVDLGSTKLPWKTTMFVDQGKITYRMGYGADEKELEVEHD